MKKKEELRFKLDEVLMEFESEKYIVAISKINDAAKFILKELNNYNRKH